MAYLQQIIEQTTWTPTLDGQVSGTTTYTSQAGEYTWIGNLIFANFKIVITAATGTGDIRITGWPYVNGGSVVAIGTCDFNGSGWSFPTGRKNARISFGSGNSFAIIRGCASGVGVGTFQMTNAALTVTGRITYFKS